MSRLTIGAAAAARFRMESLLRRVRGPAFCLILGLAATLAPALAAAEDASGCAAFKWPLEHERAALLASQKASVANGGALSYDVASVLKLAPLADAGLPQPPERAPKFASSHAGHFTLAKPAKPGFYKITLAAPAWIDVVDGGKFLHPRGFSSAADCEGARKSVKFELPARPLDVQVSGVRESEISLIVSPAD